MGLFSRALRPPPTDIVPNPNDPASVPPSTVGPDQLVEPGDPHGLVVDPDPPNGGLPPTIWPSAWSGWPADWWPPNWANGVAQLTDTAWVCVNLNSEQLSTMPPYLVNAKPSLDAGWLVNPDPDLYTGFDEFMKQLAWDYQLGEAFVHVTARYASGWPARFHVVPPWMVKVELDGGVRSYEIGDIPVDGSPGGDLLQIRYTSTVDNPHGQGPLEAGNTAIVAAQLLARYGSTVVNSIPPAVLEHPDSLSPEQSAKLKADWVLARQSSIGEPAVISGGLKWTPASMSPRDMSLVELLQLNEAKVATIFGVPPALLNLPMGDSMTYANVTMWTDHHWRLGLKPKAYRIGKALSEFLLPRGTYIELNADAYIQPEPLQRAQTAQIYAGIVDPTTGKPVLSVDEIRAAERFSGGTPIEEVIR